MSMNRLHFPPRGRATSGVRALAALAGAALTIPIAAPHLFAQSPRTNAAPSRAVAPMSASAIDRATKARVIDSMAHALITTYVDPDTGKLIAEHLHTRHRAGAFDSITDGNALAGAITRELQVVNQDLHLAAMYQPVGLSEMPKFGPRGPVLGGPSGGPSGPPPEDDPNSGFTARARRANFGIARAEVLPGNVGYLEVSQFLGSPGAEKAIASALGLLQNTDAIIIDVRRNGGGSGVMSHMLFSHFLGAKPVPTIRVRDRLEGSDRVQESMDSVPGPRRTDVPLYVLTSRRSASAAEEFAFVLRNQQRATIVGDRTAGAGHMNIVGQVGSGFALSVSFARVSDPRTGREWERTGVEPHIATAQEAALDAAHAHALRLIADKTSDAKYASRLRTLAEEAEKRVKGGAAR